jgi:hypothetical protein
LHHTLTFVLVICPTKSQEKSMPHIVVDDEQAKVISEARDNIEIRDRNGRHLGFVAHGFSDDDIAIAKQRMASDEPRYTTQQVLSRLQSPESK